MEPRPRIEAGMAGKRVRRFVLTQFQRKLHSFPWSCSERAFGCSDDEMVAEFVESKADQAGPGLSGPCRSEGHGSTACHLPAAGICRRGAQAEEAPGGGGRR